MDVADLLDCSILDQHQAIVRREVSPVELVRATLDRISRMEPEVGAFVTVLEDVGLRRAREAEAALLQGQAAGSLHGIPYGVKDNIATRGIPTTAGSRVLEGWIPDEDATCVSRLTDAGAILLGKLELYEFAFSQANVRTRNPWDLKRIAGPSSAGSAAAVATGMCSMALGTDTGGSVRIPAALCGIVGFKPTFGLISRYGVLPLSWSLDHVGPLTRTVADAALVMDILAGPDPLDEHMAEHLPSASFLAASERDIQGLRLGVLTTSQLGELDEGVQARFAEACRILESAGAEVDEIQVPDLEAAGDIASVLTGAEAAAYHGDAFRTTPERFGEDMRRRLSLGMCYLASHYIHAQRAQARFRTQFREAMAGIDALLLPTVPIVAPTFDEAERSRARGALLRNTILANVVGAPALSVPCGFAENGLPVGLQVVGKPFDDATVLAIGRAYEAVAGKRQTPKVLTGEAERGD